MAIQANEALAIGHIPQDKKMANQIFDNTRVILASNSPRRLEILRNAGLDPATISFEINEDPFDGEDPGDYVLRMAMKKNAEALAILSRIEDKTTAPHGILAFDDVGRLAIPVISGDTTVVAEGEILAKPLDRRDAGRMLGMLSGKTHEVLTSVAVHHNGETRALVNRNAVTFDEIPDALLERYLDTGESMDKAGAYAIQGYASMFIAKLEGSFTGVMGLPIRETVSLLSEYLFKA